MIEFVLRRLAVAVPVLFGVSVLVFLILHLIPGDPAQILLFGSNPTPQQLAQLRAQLGLDQPLVVQYLVYISHVLRGDLGVSFIAQQPVSAEIARRFPDTLQLTLAGMAVAVLIGAPLGVVGGVWPNTWVDRISTGASVLGVSVPYFWFALILITIVAVNLRWLPSLGEGSPQALILPAISLGWAFAAVITRLLRANLIEVYQQPYIQVARAKGLSARALLFDHAIKNALIPVITILGLQFGNMLSGAVVIEVIFGRAGIGSYLVEAIKAKDIPAVQGTVLFIAALYLLINLVVDVAYGLLDPRIRLSWARQ
jgi:ABC-type dipeptide/oligopeptide/nickel transport system permease component